MADNLETLKRRFYRPLFVALGVAASIFVLPIKPAAPNSTFRLLLTILFFAAAIFALSLLLHPRERLALAMMKDRYRSAPPQLELLAKRVIFREQFVFRWISLLGITTLSCAAIGILASWPQFHMLLGLRGLATLGFLACLGALVYGVVSGRSGLSAYTEAKGALREMEQTSEFDAEEAKGTPVQEEAVVASRGGFLAGGLDWRWDDFHKNAVVFGQPGTGKTVCVLNALFEGLLASGGEPGEPPVGGLILDPKGDFREKIRGVARRLGRESDLVIIDPKSIEESAFWNPFDTDDDELELAARFASVLEVLGTKNTQDTFWIDSAKKFMRHAIALVRFTNPGDDPPTFRDIARLAGSRDEINERLGRLPVQNEDLDMDPCLDFFEEWAGMGDRTRSSIQAQLTNMIDPFLMQPYRTVFGQHSTERIGDMIDRGRLLYVYMPIADKEAMSRTVCTLIKLEYFREVLKRVNKPRQSFFLCDEFQVYMTAGGGKGDSDFFERSRQSRHANIIACQNVPSLLKQTDQEKSVTNLLSNCAVKIFLRNTDPETNEFGSGLFGQRLVENVSVSSTSGRGLGKGAESRSTSTSAEYDCVVRPEAFTKLGIPERGVRDHAESIVHLASRSEVEQKRLRWKVHPI